MTGQCHWSFHDRHPLYTSFPRPIQLMHIRSAVVEDSSRGVHLITCFVPKTSARRHMFGIPRASDHLAAMADGRLSNVAHHRKRTRGEVP